MRIDATNIADISEIKPEEPPAALYNPPVAEVPAAPARQTQAGLDDPAILSLERPPSSGPTAPVELHNSQVVEADGEDGLAGVLQGIHVGRTFNKPLTPIQDIMEPLHSLDLNGSYGAPEQKMKPSDTEGEKSHKKKRRRQNKQTKQQQQQLQQEDSDAVSEHGGNAQSGSRGKGWRQTPMLHSSSSFQPFHSLKKKGRGRKGDENGWESADVTEEMGEFDFENNLAKFDKRTIFDQMRREDEVDDASRLVSHNRRPKPGTNGGQNLHYTESVLDTTPKMGAKNADFWNSEADDAEKEPERSNVHEARTISVMRRAESKNGASKRSQSRKASAATVGGHPLSRVNSHVSIQPTLHKKTTECSLTAITASVSARPLHRAL